MIAQAWRGLCAISAGLAELPPEQRLVVEAAALLIDPDVAGHQTEHEAAALRRVAVVGRGVDVEPDVVHVGEIAARLANELVSATGRAASRSFQHLVVLESGIELEHHVDVRVEAAGRHDDGLAAHGHRLAGLGMAALQAGDAAVLEREPSDLGLGNDLAALLAEAVDEAGHQAETIALGPGPAVHGVALLDLHVDPLHAEAFGPVIEIMQRVLDVVTGPDHVGRRTAPRDPVLEGQVGGVVDAVLPLQRRPDDQAAAAGDDGRAARLGVVLEGDGARSGIAGLDAGRHTGGTRADDGDVGLVVLGTCHWRKLPACKCDDRGRAKL